MKVRRVEVVNGCNIYYVYGLLTITVIILLKSRMGHKKIDEMYGKPYDAKLIKMIGGHPLLKQGSMAIAFHLKDALL